MSVPLKANTKMDMETQKLFNAAEGIIEKTGISSLKKELQTLKGDYSNPRFTTAVVGEFSRGKTTLVNALLNINVLPTDVRPTTALITRIIARDKEMLVFTNQKGDRSVRPLKRESWKGLNADEITSSDGVAFVAVNNSWLRDDYIELIDTPGTNDVVSERSLMADKSLIHADSAIITISALTPFSMTEKMFVQERVLYHKIPKLILCVTMMDCINEEEDRIKLLTRIRSTALDLGLEDVRIFIPQDGLFSNPDALGIKCGIDSIRNQISDWTRETDLAKLKRIQLAGHICELLEKAEAVVADQQSILANAEDSKIQKAIDERQKKIDEAFLKWDEIVEKMHERSDKTIGAVNKMFDQKEKVLSDQTCHELSKTNNPKLWIESDYPYSLKMKVIPISQMAENITIKALSQDSNWLSNTIKSLMGVTSVSADFSDVELSLDDMVSDSIRYEGKVIDTDKLRAKSRIMVGAVQVTSSIVLSLVTGGFGGTIGSVGGNTFASLFTQKKLDKKILEQKDKILPLVKEDVHNLIKAGKVKMGTQIEASYEKAIANAAVSCEEWKFAMLESFDKLKADSVEANSSKLEDLSQEIQSTINELKTSYIN